MNRILTGVIFLIFLIITISGCLEPQQISDTNRSVTDLINISSNSDKPQEEQATLDNNLTLNSDQKEFSKEGINFTYPKSYSLVDPEKYSAEALSSPEKILGLLERDDKKSFIHVYSYYVYYQARTADGIYNYVKNEMAKAKNHEQELGTYNSNYRGVERILIPSISAYIIEVKLENQTVGYDYLRQGEWVSGSYDYTYYLPMTMRNHYPAPAGYIIIFSYQNPSYADADRENRMNIIQNITTYSVIVQPSPTKS
jgi:uncharacterized protein YxeA